MSSNKLNYDGKIYHWNGSLTELKNFVEQYLKLQGSWKSPGGEVKVFHSEQSEFAIKWYGVSSKKIVIQADDEECHLELLFQSLAAVQEDNESVKSPEVVYLAESCAEDALIAKTNTGTVGEAIQDVCDQKSSGETTRMTDDFHVSEDDRLNARRVCSCKCNCGGNVVNAEIEGMKLDIVILESRLLNALSRDEITSDFNSLKAKQKDMEAVIRKQDELICNINEENMVLKSKLLSIEHLMLEQIHKNENNACNDENNNNNSCEQLHNSPESHAVDLSDKFPFYDPEYLKNVSLRSINTAATANTNKTLPRGSERSVSYAGQQTSFLANEKGTQQESNVSREENEAINKLKNENIALKLQLQNETSDKSRRKSLTPCPFLKRRGWCVKGDHCDFRHPISRHDNDKHMVPCPFLRKNGFCLKGNSCDFSHGGLPYSVEWSRSAPEVQSHLYNSFLSNRQSPTFPMPLIPPRIPPRIPPGNPPYHPQMPRLAQSQTWPTPLMAIPIYPPAPYRI